MRKDIEIAFIVLVQSASVARSVGRPAACHCVENYAKHVIVVATLLSP